MYQDPLPLSAFQRIDLDTTPQIALQVQLRKTRLKDGIDPPAANAWVYRTGDSDGSVLDNYLGPILNVHRGQRVQIDWINTLGPDPAQAGAQEPPPIHGPGPKEHMQAPLGIVTHLHGGKVTTAADGWPLEPAGYQGNDCGLPSRRRYGYRNDQRAAMLWYHDHAMDHTAPQVHAGLAGLYFIRDRSDRRLRELIHDADGSHELPLVIQDRCLLPGFQGFDYGAGLPPDRPEFLGNTLFVNGRPSPFLETERRVYRLRLLNGSNARSYALALLNPDAWSWHSGRMWVIGSDAGLLAYPVQLANWGYLVLAPGERRDLLLDLTGLAGISRLRLMNLALAARVRQETPEPIYTYGLPRAAGDSGHSVLTPDQRTPDNLTRIDVEALAGVLELRLDGVTETPLERRFAGRLTEILEDHADGDGFRWNRRYQTLEPCWSVRANRLVVLLNNTAGAATDPDVEMLELCDDPALPGLDLPFEVDLGGNAAPADAQPLVWKPFGIARRTLFAEPHRHAHGSCYPELHPPTFQPLAGSYERWYVANIGNEPADAQSGRAVPELHPFHLHLVNFVVGRRWVKDAEGRFVIAPRSMLDGIARHDTVRIAADELLELIVHFPRHYSGQSFVYHCHLAEHEDMGMMLHYQLA